MPISWITHGGKRILYTDYRTLKEDQMLGLLAEGFIVTAESPEPILVLMDLRETFVTGEFIKKLKSYGSEIKGKIIKASVLGIAGVKKILFNTILVFLGSPDFKAFTDEGEAKEYLAR
jgi:hypothetical protein